MSSLAEASLKLPRAEARQSDPVAPTERPPVPGSGESDLMLGQTVDWRYRIESRIGEGRGFGFILADLDRFKAFNDYYGCERGDRVILKTAELLSEALREAGESRGCLGHIGGDDFILICEEEKASLVAAFATMKFDEAVPGLYDAADAARGFIEIKDRSDTLKRHAPLSLSVAGVSSLRRPIPAYADAVRWAGEVKRWLKSTRSSGPSALAFDRRKGGV